MTTTLDTYKPKNAALLYHRRYKDTDEVSIEDLKQAYVQAAELVRMDKIYLPIFQRIDEELQKRQSSQSILEKALAVAENASYSTL